MIVIPNLFGAYQKGREEAIKANWDDLSNYEDIEAKRTQNDLNALTLLGRQADFGYDRENVRLAYNKNQRDDELGNVSHAGNIATAMGNNLLAAAAFRVVNDRNKNGDLYELGDLNFGTLFANAETSSLNADTNRSVANITNQVMSRTFDEQLKAAIELKKQEVGRALTAAEVERLRGQVVLAYTQGVSKNLNLQRWKGENNAKAAAINAGTSVTTATTAADQATEALKNQATDRSITKTNQITSVTAQMQTALITGDEPTYNALAGLYQQLTGQTPPPFAQASAGVSGTSSVTTTGQPDRVSNQLTSLLPQTIAVTPTYTPNGAPVGHSSLMGKRGGGLQPYQIFDLSKGLK